ncbi:MAG: glycine zipper family protein [Cyanobacteria bacterium CRU_2_1]|nr:glycine zipper family protein [Cyanobacteria bacterium RU_5_0]NJR62651.1 glycine zipper family protein [Cyanobacteria bacterium CRU_2_1]
MNSDRETRDRNDIPDRVDNEQVEANPNRDPFTGETGAHPVGTGIGAAAAGALGTAIGAVAGPVGAVVGATIGSVIGGLVGKGAAEAINPTVEDAYWRNNYLSRPYVHTGRVYEDYQPAYRTGYEGYTRYQGQGKTYDELEPELKRDYETQYPRANMQWDDAKYATRDAWNRAGNNALFFNEDHYWRQNYTSQPYYDPGLTYEDYQPAYRTGYENYIRYRDTGRTYDEIEPELRQDYEQQYGSSGLGWEKAKYAVRAAWNRLERAVHR